MLDMDKVKLQCYLYTSTSKTNIEQTVGIIDTATYQTFNLQAYLDSPDVSDKDSTNT